MLSEIDLQRIKRYARDSIPLIFTTFTLPQEMELYLDKVLEAFLAELGLSRLREPLSYCLRELAVNAKKANTKRVYFLEKGLSLKHEPDYEAGMRGFKEDTLSDMRKYLEKQKDSGLYVKVVFQSGGGTFTISVRNNVEITKREQTRVHDRLARSRAFHSLEEAYATVLDDSEGAGLGIVIMALMLRKIGLSETCFAIDAEAGETVASLTIPLS